MILRDVLQLSKQPIPETAFSVLLSRETLEARDIFHTRHNTFYVTITDPSVDKYYIIGQINSSYFTRLYLDSFHRFQGNTKSAFLNLPFRLLNPTLKEEKTLHDRIIYGAKEILKIQAEMELAEDLFLKHLNTFIPRPSKGSLKDYLHEVSYGTLLEAYQFELSQVKVRALRFEEEITQGEAGEDLHFGQTHLLRLSYLPHRGSAYCPILRWRVEEENLKLFLLFAVPHSMSHMMGKAGLKEKVSTAEELLEEIKLPYWFSTGPGLSGAAYNQEQIILLMQEIKKEHRGVMNPSIQARIRSYISKSLDRMVAELIRSR